MVENYFRWHIGPPPSCREKFRRQLVSYQTEREPGSIVVDSTHRFLDFVLRGDRALRYGIGVGREGFAWEGLANIGQKAIWPKWIPPMDMVARDPFAAEWAEGMPGGPHNPLGARALYLYADSADPLYRIHGTNQPETIGQAVSSGCVRLLNSDTIDLYDPVGPNTSVLVLGPRGDTVMLALSHQHPPESSRQRVRHPSSTPSVRRTDFKLRNLWQIFTRASAE